MGPIEKRIRKRLGEPLASRLVVCHYCYGFLIHIGIGLILLYSGSILLLKLSHSESLLGLTEAQVEKVAIKLANPVVSVMAIGAGFVGVSLSIVSSSSTGLLKNLRDNPEANRQLVLIHAQSISLGAFSCLINLLVLVREVYGSGQLTALFLMLWLFSNISAAWSFHRLVSAIIKILRNP